jgi:hypothetical protein
LLIRVTRKEDLKLINKKVLSCSQY